jgi:hypothetical protein
MDKSKAKKAVKKSESRKKEAQAAEAMLGMQAAAAMGIDPEIQAPQADMQPATVNPYHAMGSMAPMMYSAGNMLPGYNYPVMVNPEE